MMTHHWLTKSILIMGFLKNVYIGYDTQTCNIVDPMHEKVRLHMHNHIVKYDLVANDSHMLKTKI